MPETWTPTPAQVHALIPTRNNGRPFDVNSTPTAAEVSALAEGITAEIIGEVGTLPPLAQTDPVLAASADAIHDLAAWTAQLGTAAIVELGVYPEQSDFGGDNTVGGTLFARYRRAVEQLKRRVATFGTGGSGIVSVPLVGTLTQVPPT